MYGKLFKTFKLFAIMGQVYDIGRGTVEKLNSNKVDIVYERELVKYVEESAP
jgi:hypothetical protein